MDNIFVEFLPPWIETNMQPAFYDKESGTCLQQTARMYDRVNMLVRMFNKLSKQTKETVEEYIGKFNELHDYVMDYFANLDVQEEINNKLDDMAEDGTLKAIIDEYLDRYYLNKQFYRKYYFNTVLACPFLGKDNAGFGMQGGCVLPDGSIIQYTGDSHKLQKWSQDGTLMLEVTSNYGHGNSMTFCDDTGTIFITATQDDDLGKYTIFEVDPTTFALINTYDPSNDFPAIQSSICWDNVNKRFIFTNYWQTSNIGSQYIWSTDKLFNVIESKAYSFNISGVSNTGNVFGNIGVLVIQNNELLEFDPVTLEFIQSSYMSNKVGDVWFSNENEWFDTRNNKLYVGFLCGETNVFGVYDPELPYEETNPTSAFSKADVTYYVDYDNTNYLRNGTNSNPFSNINEAINASKSSDNFSDKVTITLKNSPSKNDEVIFSGNKTFILSYTGQITCIGKLTVRENCTVVTDKNIAIQGNASGVRSLRVDGNLYGRYLDNSDNSTVVLKGNKNGFIQAGFNYGLDLTEYLGKVESLGNNLGYASLTGLPASGLYNPIVKYYQYSVPVVENETHKFQIPRMSPMMMLTIKYTDTDGNHEESFAFNYGRYYNFIISSTTTINISTAGLLTISSNTSNLRVIASGM